MKTIKLLDADTKQWKAYIESIDAYNKKLRMDYNNSEEKARERRINYEKKIEKENKAIRVWNESQRKKEEQYWKLPIYKRLLVDEPFYFPKTERSLPPRSFSIMVGSKYPSLEGFLSFISGVER